jgi:hypothetical protein
VASAENTPLNPEGSPETEISPTGSARILAIHDEAIRIAKRIADSAYYTDFFVDGGPDSPNSAFHEAVGASPPWEQLSEERKARRLAIVDRLRRLERGTFLQEGRRGSFLEEGGPSFVEWFWPETWSDVFNDSPAPNGPWNEVFSDVFTDSARSQDPDRTIPEIITAPQGAAARARALSKMSVFQAYLRLREVEEFTRE